MSDNLNMRRSVNAYTKECLEAASLTSIAAAEIMANIEYQEKVSQNATPELREQALDKQSALVVVMILTMIDYVFWIIKAKQDDNGCISTAESEGMRQAGDNICASVIELMGRPNFLQFIQDDDKTSALWTRLNKACVKLLEFRGLIESIALNEAPVDAGDAATALSILDDIHQHSSEYLDYTIMDLLETDRPIPPTSLRADFRVLEVAEVEYTPFGYDYVVIWSEVNF